MQQQWIYNYKCPSVRLYVFMFFVHRSALDSSRIDNGLDPGWWRLGRFLKFAFDDCDDWIPGYVVFPIHHGGLWGTTTNARYVKR